MPCRNCHGLAQQSLQPPRGRVSPEGGRCRRAPWLPPKGTTVLAEHPRQDRAERPLCSPFLPKTLTLPSACDCEAVRPSGWRRSRLAGRCSEMGVHVDADGPEHRRSQQLQDGFSVSALSKQRQAGAGLGGGEPVRADRQGQLPAAYPYFAPSLLTKEHRAGHRSGACDRSGVEAALCRELRRSRCRHADRPGCFGLGWCMRRRMFGRSAACMCLFVIVRSNQSGSKCPPHQRLVSACSGSSRSAITARKRS